MRFVFLLRFVVLPVGIFRVLASLDAKAEPLRTGYLRVEVIENPEGIDTADPLLSWQVASNQRRAQIQSSYRIIVARSADEPESMRDVLWDSGGTASRRTFVRYTDSEISSGQRCFWKVMAWNRSDEPSPWSEVSRAEAAHEESDAEQPGYRSVSLKLENVRASPGAYSNAATVAHAARR